MKLPSEVTIVEVGPRDGLQNERTPIATESKCAFVEKLVEAGLKHIEVTSFVHPRAVPQLSDAAELLERLPDRADVRYSALVPNLKGLERAVDAGLRHIAVFTAASDTFTARNIKMTVSESVDLFREVIEQARGHAMSVRAYVSTAFVCPYEGDIDRGKVRDLTLALLDAGAEEIAISDTIGAAAPSDVFETVGYVLEEVPAEHIALHFHDTYGTGLANVCAGLELGIETFDASAGGLGGCPYAPGAAGNLATEDLVYLLQRMNIRTAVDLEKLAEASRFVEQAVRHPLPSKQLQRLRADHG